MLSTKLERIAKIAREHPHEEFTSLAHLLDEEMFIKCHKELGTGKATGIDKVTKEEYGKELNANISDLVARLKCKRYRPQPVKRVYIPKPGSEKKRPLGIPAYEDKLVQLGLAKILTPIYEADFIESSFGFRPGRSCHDALSYLNHIIVTRKVSYVVDADIKGFFDHVDHEWMMRFLSHRVKDPSIHHIVRKFLKMGYSDDGVRYELQEGTPQGGVISPLLANIYLHYVLDLWFERKIKKRCRGEAYIVRYCDDFVCCFQHRSDAVSFYSELKLRLKKFNLEIAEEKSKIIAFGRFARNEADKQGRGKPSTFDFLGFTHYCSNSLQGKFRVKRKTSRKKYKASLLRVKEWLRKRLNVSTKEVIAELKVKLVGYYRYYGVTDNIMMLSRFLQDVRKLLFRWLNRKSQRRSCAWDKFSRICQAWELPRPKIYVNIFKRGELLGYSL